MGETGAGKTTTARSIIRLLPSVGHVTSGTIEFEDRNLLELPEAEMRLFRGDKIAMVFQDPMTSLNPVMSVGDQIAETIKSTTRSWTKRKWDAGWRQPWRWWASCLPVRWNIPINSPAA